MIDAELAELYQVPTKVLNQAVRRNVDRFPDDFMFHLKPEEAESINFQSQPDNLRSQFVTSSYGGRRYLPYAFTEHGVAMLSSVLRSKRAVQMNILIIRAFVKMRELLASHKELAVRVEILEAAQYEHGSILGSLVEEIEDLKRVPENSPHHYGFKAGHN
jgi:hypothetical protein